MTAPRMTDEQFDAHANGRVLMSDFAAIYNEGLRARSAESAALARVAELEAALSSLIQDADEDHSSEEDSLYRTVLVDTVEAARAALSEET